LRVFTPKPGFWAVFSPPGPCAGVGFTSTPRGGALSPPRGPGLPGRQRRPGAPARRRRSTGVDGSGRAALTAARPGQLRGRLSITRSSKYQKTVKISTTQVYIVSILLPGPSGAGAPGGETAGVPRPSPAGDRAPPRGVDVKPLPARGQGQPRGPRGGLSRDLRAPEGPRSPIPGSRDPDVSSRPGAGRPLRASPALGTSGTGPGRSGEWGFTSTPRAGDLSPAGASRGPGVPGTFSGLPGGP